MLRYFFSNGKANARGPAIFIDRDGVINCRRPGDYVLEFSQFVFVPGIRAALKELTSFRLPMIIISNQAAVGKRLLEPAGLEEITARMREALLQEPRVIGPGLQHAFGEAPDIGVIRKAVHTRLSISSIKARFGIIRKAIGAWK